MLLTGSARKAVPSIVLLENLILGQLRMRSKRLKKIAEVEAGLNFGTLCIGVGLNATVGAAQQGISVVF